MKEMKGAWENYATKDKAKFKPQFNFDAIADFDRALYNQINNPLILRLFLEIYNGKSLPKKGVKHLNIWQDWLQTFTKEEQTFLKLLANEVWIKGENELLLDDLLKQETLKPYFISDIINSPYNRLKNTGWISLYVKDLNANIGYTVEGALLYLLALQLQEQKTIIDFAAVQALLKSGNKLKRSAIESYLCEQALSGNLNLVTDLIDVGDEYIDLCIKPLILYIKTFGVKATIEMVLESPSKNDWIALEELDGQLEELQLHILRKDFLLALMAHNLYDTKESVELGLKAIPIFDKEDAMNQLSKVDPTISFIAEDAKLLFLLGDCERKFGSLDKALNYYDKSLTISLQTLDSEHLDIIELYNNIGITWDRKGNDEKSLEYKEKCLELILKTLGADHTFAAIAYNNIGLTWDSKGDYDKALEYYDNCLAIYLKNLGGEHPNVATTYNNIGTSWRSKDEYDKAIQFYEKSLAIFLKTLGNSHSNVARLYNNIAVAWEKKCEYVKALAYYEKSLAIDLITLGETHSSISNLYKKIGKCHYNLKEHAIALELFTKGFNTFKNGEFLVQIGRCHEAMGNKALALDYYIQSAEIRKSNPKVGLESKLTKHSIEQATRLAKELGKENDLPDWIKMID